MAKASRSVPQSVRQLPKPIALLLEMLSASSLMNAVNVEETGLALVLYWDSSLFT